MNIAQIQPDGYIEPLTEAVLPPTVHPIWPTGSTSRSLPETRTVLAQLPVASRT